MVDIVLTLSLRRSFLLNLLREKNLYYLFLSYPDTTSIINTANVDHVSCCWKKKVDGYNVEEREAKKLIISTVDNLKFLNWSRLFDEIGILGYFFVCAV